MNEESKEILRKNGWYEGRKINGAEWYQYYERGGVRVFDTFKKFFEEFGLLEVKIQSKTNPGFNFYDEILMIPTIYIPKSFENISYEEEDEILEYQQLCKEKLLQVGIFGYGNCSLYISESGKFYDQDGFISNDKENLWTYLINDKYPEFILYENLKN